MKTADCFCYVFQSQTSCQEKWPVKGGEQRPVKGFSSATGPVVQQGHRKPAAAFSARKIFRGPDGKGTDQRNGNLFFQFFQIALGLLSCGAGRLRVCRQLPAKEWSPWGRLRRRQRGRISGERRAGNSRGPLPGTFLLLFDTSMMKPAKSGFASVHVSDILRPSEAADFNLCHRRFKLLSACPAWLFCPRLA